MDHDYRQRWFEDYLEGETAEFGDHQVSEEEIVAFARRYDPQPFHVDADAARRSPFGGLIASGWMTCSIAMRMLVEHFISEHASMGSPGLDSLRWPAPVRPGDRLRVRVTVLESRPSRSKPDRGSIRLRQEVLNQHDEVVMLSEGWGIYRRRPPGGAGSR
ncbi:MAG: MaoC family dehydratase [Burkholderiaceae bacterium]|nr:MaoC family dehydratase [Burkholderiaceae bacterium]